MLKPVNKITETEFLAEMVRRHFAKPGHTQVVYNMEQPGWDQKWGVDYNIPEHYFTPEGQLVPNVVYGNPNEHPGYRALHLQRIGTSIHERRYNIWTGCDTYEMCHCGQRLHHNSPACGPIITVQVIFFAYEEVQ